MQRHLLAARVFGLAILVCGGVSGEARSQEPGCRTGAVAIADAYLLANPLYAYYLGDLETYIDKNTEHFRTGGDAIRCASALSTAFLRSAVQLYDPTDQQRRAELNAQLGAMGISSGPPQASPGSELLMTSMQLARLARVLPAAAAGDYGPYRTPANELEQMQIVAGQAFRMLLQNGETRSIFAQMEPLIKEIATLEHKALLRHAAALAGPAESTGSANCDVTPSTPQCLFLEGGRAVAGGNLVAAKRAFQRVRESAPTDERWPMLEGIVWYRAGRLAEAEEANRRGLEINPNSFTGHDNLAFILFDFHRLSEALVQWDKALEIRRDDPDALAGKAITLQSLQRSSEAVALYRRAVRQNSKYLDCEIMQKEFFWSAIACAAAEPLMNQVRQSP